MTTTVVAPRAKHAPSRPPALDIVIPVYNEEKALVSSVQTVRSHLHTLPFEHRITIADNASTDRTRQLAQQLADRFDDVRVVCLDQKGRGRALKRAWSQSDAEVLVYMDVDLSTDLNALLPLVAPLLSGHSDLAIGSRLARTSRTVRGPRREVISRAYNLLLHGTLRARFSDAQCGFKAIRRDVAQQLLPLIQDDEWFFDTELLVVAERAGLRIHEVPVDWVDDPDSRVDIVRTAAADLRGMGRLGWALLRGRIPLTDVAQALGRASSAGAGGRLGGQMIVFAVIGALSTAAYGVLYVALRTVMGAFAANALALALTAVVNTAANRRFTFGLRGPENHLRQQLQGLLVFAAGLAVTSGTLWLMRAVGGGGHPLVEVAVLTAANLLVTVMRFVAMRMWIFRRPAAGSSGRS
ncbi:bifunctional glycosyltransferase family 2/GtrA family protein [Aeromicrobium wangtongii]|uniref:dolichyl-phosphate beta-glucosyltransferase n=1 Tax=Aeromicrobium wangtongii TaxID=2969247 RepID=A0ABY5M8X6_9ACTN|nr:bifunctional glycosyltransferase family 2/GtrA family protein [Aeromicrobium wangtongii]MCD9197088.1 bifunctional glycosyltransferase family 2/GtrA family protein [Aeromicrobium wangtongii]UUP14588.1 bifunctional glycosyltransferase family 2/GtrA family protein [Aeromicrobium wangtongii]